MLGSESPARAIERRYAAAEAARDANRIRQEQASAASRFTPWMPAA